MPGKNRVFTTRVDPISPPFKGRGSGFRGQGTKFGTLKSEPRLIIKTKFFPNP